MPRRGTPPPQLLVVLTVAQPRRQGTLERQAGRGAAALASPSVPPPPAPRARLVVPVGARVSQSFAGRFPRAGATGPQGQRKPPQGAWASLAPAWPLCGFSAASYLFLPPPPNKPTLRKRGAAVKALSWPLPSWRFSTSREGLGTSLGTPKALGQRGRPKMGLERWLQRAASDGWGLKAALRHLASCSGHSWRGCPVTKPPET
ncbi:uncharacterized protein LOC123946294 [Meles meles]|uniref:uncharacterized protein LOC123946294 n=1 Tax=Meles meles TaxID=9662 RepID=UPI001E69D00C|nr:uncharacterized protein LOC123946294 [Meles meles]